MENNRRKVKRNMENCCGVENCKNSIKKSKLMFITLPPNRKGHSKWLKETFGDTEISNNCRIVCEAHMDPGFVKILKQRHKNLNGVKDIPSKTTGPSPGPSGVTSRPQKRKVGRPKKSTKCKRTKKVTAKQSKDRAGIKKKSSPHAYDPLSETDECMEEMAELMIIEEKEETSEVTASNEPPQKHEILQTLPFQLDNDDNDSITYEIVIKDDPDNFETEVSVDDVKVKCDHPDKTEVMDHVCDEPDPLYQPVVDVKIETTDNFLEDYIDYKFFEYKILPPSLIVENKSKKPDLTAPKAFKTFSELLDILLKQKLISLDQRNILAQYNLDSSYLFMDYSQLLSPNLKIKSFVIALYIMSHKAYDFVLRTNKTRLPSVTAIKYWLVQQKGHSGFTRETLEAINFITKDKGRIKSPINVCLVLKEIKLHQYNRYRSPSNRVLNLGGNTTNPLDSSLATANSVWVLTVVAINASWKLPIGYFWDNVVKGAERANLVKVAIEMLETVRVVPVAISFESNDDNRRMCEELSGSHTPTIKEYFISYSGIPIFLFPDPCDILEQIYMDIKDVICYDESRKVVSLTHLSELVKYANIPSEKPITLKKVIASELCRKDFCSYKGPGAGTLTFLKHFQNVFDILYCRHSVQGHKQMEAMQVGKLGDVIHRQAVMLREAVVYIKSLKFKDFTETLVALDRFSSLMWFCTLTETTLMMIYKYWRQWSIPFGKFIGNSSNFLSNLMPQCNGDKNPTANTFQREYKAMLEENIPKPLVCSTNKKIQNFLVLKCKNPVDIINLSTAIPNGNKLKMIDNDYWKLLRCRTDEFTDEFIVYLSRYVTTTLIYQLHCETCIGAIRNTTIAMSEKQKTRPEHGKVKKKLVMTKSDEPSSDVIDICKISEAVFKTAVLHRKWSGVKLHVPFLVSKVLKKYLYRPLFVDLLNHQFDTDRTCNHLIELARAVASSYLNLRINYWTRNVPYQPKQELGIQLS